jgi:hypothetical protein
MSTTTPGNPPIRLKRKWCRDRLHNKHMHLSSTMKLSPPAGFFLQIKLMFYSYTTLSIYAYCVTIQIVYYMFK